MQQMLRNLAAQTSAQADEPLRMLAQRFQINARLIMKPLQIPDRAKLHQILVSCHVFRQYKEVIDWVILARSLLKARARRHIQLTADNRLDSRRLACSVERHRPVHHAMIG
ncbi:hypothetical protein D3C80_1616460 [compost metagenome]